MPSLDHDFGRLQQRLNEGFRLRDTGDDPVYYMVFEPSAMLEAKRKLTTWKSKLELDGWTVHIFSMSEVIHDVFQHHPLRKFWLSEEKRTPLDFNTINKTLSEALGSQQVLDSRMRKQQEALADEDSGLMLITDLEALHPYARIGGIESRLQGEFTVPTVILYPGTRHGEHKLSFLDIYPPDGNYRSVHIGGTS